MPLHTYSPADHVVNFQGFELSGFADGTFIDAAMDSPGVTDVAGADGEVARAASADERGKVVLTLLQTSASNDVLTARHALDKLTKLGVGPIFVKDLRGTTTVQGAEAWIEKYADISLSKEVQGREWTFRVAHMQPIVGGNL